MPAAWGRSSGTGQMRVSNAVMSRGVLRLDVAGSRTRKPAAAAGSAVGLGNIWRFPYTTGENGGGLFVIVYLLCVALIGLPILMSEIIIGRAAQRQPVGAFAVLEGKRTAWSGVGWLGVLAGFIILSYYVVVAGWAMDYTLKSIVNFTGAIERQAAVDALAPRRDDLVLRLRARRPFDAGYLLSFFWARAIPGLEQVGADLYGRGFRLGDAVGLMICRFARDGSGVEVSLRGAARHKVLEIGGRVRRLFDLDADIGAISALLADDPLLGPLVTRRPGLRVPGSWDRFELAVRAVLGQQVSLAAARTLAGRLVAHYGEALPEELVAGSAVTHLFPTAGILAGQDLTPIGLTRRRARTLSAVIDLFAGPGSHERAGELILAARYVRVGEREIRLRSFAGGSGKDRTKSSVALAATLGFPALLVRGGPYGIAAGTLAPTAA